MTDIDYDEVGVIEIATAVNDGDFMGIGATETAKIGRPRRKFVVPSSGSTSH